ncbi:MAG: esterase-like activity of phytase family protein [Bdellovibrionales bacterium]
MAQLVFLLLAFVQAQTLTQLSSQTFESEMEFKGVRLGGLSGLHYRDQVLWALSDDRGGKAGDPRIYKFELIESPDKKQWSVKPVDMIYLGEASGSKVLDPEAVYVFSDGRLLLSSEGDLNQKPRVAPMVRFWNPKDKWLKEISLPKQVLPEKTGLQTQGISNNAGFESMTVSTDEKKLWMMSELPLFQNQKSEIEIFEFHFEKKWKAKKTYSYKRDAAPEGKVEVLRGLSEALYWKDNHLLVFERYLRVEPNDPKSVGATLYSVKLNEDGGVEKKKLLTLEQDLGANWEGLTRGPELSDGARLLILVSDNNFEKKNLTRFLFYSFKE